MIAIFKCIPLFIAYNFWLINVYIRIERKRVREKLKKSKEIIFISSPELFVYKLSKQELMPV